MTWTKLKQLNYKQHSGVHYVRPLKHTIMKEFIKTNDLDVREENGNVLVSDFDSIKQYKAFIKAFGIKADRVGYKYVAFKLGPSCSYSADLEYDCATSDIIDKDTLMFNITAIDDSLEESRGVRDEVYGNSIGFHMDGSNYSIEVNVTGLIER